MNQYVEIAKMVFAALTFVVNVIVEKKQSEQSGAPSDVSTHVDRGVTLLQGIGKIGKIKELQGLDLTELKPSISEFISKIHELKALNKE